jgi:hypothetical protein
MGWQEGGVGTTCDMRHAMPLSHAHASTKSRAPRRARQDACAFFSSLSCGGKRKLNFSRRGSLPDGPAGVDGMGAIDLVT